MFAFEIPLFCSLVTFAAAWLFCMSWRIKLRPWWVLVAMFGWLSWTIYFALLAISAGPAPVLNRADIAFMIHLAEVLGALLIAIWLVFWGRQGLRYPWHISDDKASYLREDGC